ncbi:MAG: SDR family oxidoreductase [Acidobacteria bacterium]|nr:SDR family oxidoreductase [Acidobacteriota bacterium]
MAGLGRNHWALILGGSSGFGLAVARRLSSAGMNLCVVHRDRRGAMERIEREFAEIQKTGVGFLSLNIDALSLEGLDSTLTKLAESMGSGGKVRLLFHSIAYGNLKPLVAAAPRPAAHDAQSSLAGALGIDEEKLERGIQQAFGDGAHALFPLVTATYGDAVMEDEDMVRTIYSMGTSLLTWVQRVHAARLFADDARVIALTSEGNEVAWRGYAAVAAAKSALESVSRAIAVEFGPYGIRSNIIQAGVTDTPALRVIPGSDRMKAAAALRNPLGRMTRPEDVADVVYLLCTPEAQWVNGALIRVDGGEHIASV